MGTEAQTNLTRYLRDVCMKWFMLHPEQEAGSDIVNDDHGGAGQKICKGKTGQLIEARWRQVHKGHGDLFSAYLISLADVFPV